MSESRLFRDCDGLIGARMNTRFPIFVTLALLLALPAAAETKKPAPAAETKKPAPAAETNKPAPAAKPVAASAGPKAIGKFDDWTAATHSESGANVCYAFTRAQTSSPALPGRGPVILTVTERTSGRDTVAIEAGFSYAANAAMTMQVDQTGLDFYTNGRNAFAREGKAAVMAFGKGSRAIGRSPGPKDAAVTDTFSLKGFAQAYAAIVKACPAK